MLTTASRKMCFSCLFVPRQELDSLPSMTNTQRLSPGGVDLSTQVHNSSTAVSPARKPKILWVLCAWTSLMWWRDSHPQTPQFYCFPLFKGFSSKNRCFRRWAVCCSGPEAGRWVWEANCLHKPNPIGAWAQLCHDGDRSIGGQWRKMLRSTKDNKRTEDKCESTALYDSQVADQLTKESVLVQKKRKLD